MHVPPYQFWCPNHVLVVHLAAINQAEYTGQLDKPYK